MRMRNWYCGWAVALAAGFAAPDLGAEEDAGAATGFAVSVFGSRFIGGDSGPTTPVSDTSYGDTFDTGLGMRAEVHKDFGSGWRGQAGLVYSSWGGRQFTGGEFPGGAEFGDFSLAGPYIGGTVFLRDAAAGLRPYCLGNLGLVRLSGLDVVSAGSAVPYWSATWKDYLELGCGLARPFGTATALTFDLRLQAFGKPRSENFPVAEATGGQSLLFSIGVDFGPK